MALRLAYVLLFTVCAFGLGIAAPAFPSDEKCGANAEYLTCGSACVPDCAHPQPPVMCTMQCVIGCFCKEGFLKNANGECVRPQECDAPHHEIPMQFPQTQPKCPDNEFFNPCGSACAPTCANPNPSPVCTKNCVIGCFCNEGHLRDARGVCVPASRCNAPAEVMPIAAQVCGDNEEFRQCKGCDGTCKNPNPLCPRICKPGCACKEGHLRNDDGKCVETRECSTQVQPESFMMLPPVEKCDANEEYRQCKGCDGTCQDPDPLCPRICKAGCACKRGFLRSDAGKCVATRECATKPQSFQMLPPKCNANEIFLSCGTACPATCANPHPSPVCTRNCVIGCFCKEGYLKNAQGVCVAAANC